MNPIHHKIKEQKIVPLFYNASFEVSKSIIQTLYDAGIRVIEYTNRGPQASQNFKNLKEYSKTECPDLFLGIGTIKNTEELDLFINSEADFIITPVINEELILHAKGRNSLIIPGCLTPSEVNIAFQNDLKLVKIFPADVVGKKYIQSIKAVFPGMDFMPTGGISSEFEDIKEWLNGGAIAVGQGSALIANDTKMEDLKNKITELFNHLNS